MRMSVFRPLARGCFVPALALLIALVGGCTKPPLEVQEIAEREHLQGKTKEAIIRLKDLIASQPANAKANLLLGRILFEVGNLEAAEEPLLVASEAAETRDVARLLLLQTWLHKNQPRRIIEATQDDAQSNSGADREVLSIRGRAFLKESRPAEAKAMFDRILQADPDHPWALVGQAQLVSSQGKHVEAVALLERAIARDPRLFDAWFLKAELERGLGDLAAAHRSYTRARDILPESASVLIGMAAVEIGQKRYERARATLEALRKARPADPEANYLEAFAEFQKGNYATARDIAKGLLGQAPNHVPSLVVAGVSEYALRSYSEAARYLRAAAERSGLPVPTVAILSAALLHSDQWELAFNVATAGLKSAPRDRNLHIVAGEAALQLDRPAEAVSHFTEAVRALPKNATLRTRLGVSLTAAGQFDHAATEFELAGRLDPKSNRAAIAQVMALIRKGDFRRAEFALQKISGTDAASPLVRNLEAAVALGNKDPATARAKLRAALALDPGFLPSTLNLMNLDIGEKNFASASAHLEAALSRDPKNLPALLARADLAVRAGEPAAAVQKHLEQAHKAHPQSPEPLLLLAKHHARTGSHDAAVRAAIEARRIAPDKPEVYETLGALQLDAKDYSNAVASFARLVTLKPNSASAHYGLGRAQIGNGNRASARLSFQRALAIRPDHIDAKAAIAAMELDEWKFSAALAIARELQQEAPKAAAGYLIEADAYILEHKPAEAARFYSRAFELAPTERTAVRLHDAMLRAQQPAEADKHLLEWLEKRPKNLSARMYLATTFARRNMYREAAEQYSQVLAVQPDNILVLSNMAVALHKANDPRARAYTEKALALAPTTPVLLDTLAQILFAENQLNRSRDLWERAVVLAPDAADMRYRYAVVLAKTGRRELAITELRKALESPRTFPGRRDAERLLKALDPEREQPAGTG